MRTSTAIKIAAAVISVSAPYNHHAAGEFARIASSMSCGDSTHGGTRGLVGWTWPPLEDGGVPAPQPSGMSSQYIDVLENTTAGTFGTVINVARSGANSRVVVIAFRATMVQQNCLQTLDEHLAPYPPQRELQVHRGFYNAYASLRAQTLEAISRVVERPGSVERFVLTGWSLGGAMASCLTMDLRARGYEQPITVYAFGAPRVGDAAFASAFRALHDVDAYNVWHRGDPVPECGLFVPHGAEGCTQYERGFRQAIGRTVWYPAGLGGRSEHVVCEADSRDPECTPRAGDLSADDHLFYLGEGMMCCEPAGDDAPMLAPAEGGAPVLETLQARCRAPFAVVCNPEGRHEPEERGGVRALKANVGGRPHEALQPE